MSRSRKWNADGVGRRGFSRPIRKSILLSPFFTVYICIYILLAFLPYYLRIWIYAELYEKSGNIIIIQQWNNNICHNMSNSNKTISGPNYTPPKIKHTTLVYTNFNFFQKKQYLKLFYQFNLIFVKIWFFKLEFKPQKILIAFFNFSKLMQHI